MITGLSYPDDPFDLKIVHGVRIINIRSTSNAGHDNDKDECKEDESQSLLKDTKDKSKSWSEDQFWMYDIVSL